MSISMCECDEFKWAQQHPWGVYVYMMNEKARRRLGFFFIIVNAINDGRELKIKSAFESFYEIFYFLNYYL